jgi:hypothetical protein
MAITTKYAVLSATSALSDWLDLDLNFGSVTLDGQEIKYVGSGLADAVFIRPGVTVDFTAAGGGVDKLYFSGNFADYTVTQSGSFAVLERTVGGKLEKATVAAGDTLVFSDGYASSLSVVNFAKGTAVAPTPNPAETSVAPTIASTQSASVKAAALVQTGVTFAQTTIGVALTVVGGTGVDTVYVKTGTEVDAKGLGGGVDIVYLTGNYTDYAKSVSGASLVLERTINGNHEKVTLAVGDKVVFADGAATTLNVKNNLTAPLPPGWDTNTVTPGLSDIQSITITSTPGPDNTYTVGDTIEFTVTMKAGKTVDITGAPTLTFKIGTTDVTGTLQATGTGLSTFKFTHVVTAGENDANGISVTSNAIALNGGHIYSAGTTTEAKITNSAVADSATHMVDTVAPVVTDATISISGATGTNGAYKNGDTVTVVYDPAGDTSLATVTADFTAFGGGAAVAATLATTGANAGKWVATYAVLAGTLDATNLNVSITATDRVGLTTTASDTTNATVDNQAPVAADANISISGATGTAGAYKAGDTVVAVFTPTGNADLSTVTVDFTAFGGGAAVAATLATTGTNAGKYVASYVVAAGTIDAVNANVSVTATDDAGNTTTTADSSNATVDNQAPVVADANISISGATGNANTVYKIGDTVTAVYDPAGNADIASVAMNFSAFGGSASVAATLETTGVNAGKYVATYQVVSGVISASNLNVSVTATDNAGNALTTADTSNATVDSAAPTVIISTDKLTVLGGQTATITFTFSDVPTGFAWDENTQTGDLTVANGSVGAIQTTADPKVFTAVFTPTAGNTVQLTGSVAVTAASYTDASGNLGVAGAPISITAPASASITTTLTTATDDATLNGSTAVGAITAGQSSDDATPTLTGTISAGLSGTQAVWIYDTVNGVATKLGSATVTNSTDWSYTPTALGAGVHSLTARVEDSSNNAIGASSAAFSHKVQTVAISNFYDNVGTVTGTVAAGGSSDDSTPTLNGTLGVALTAGEEVGIYDGTTLLGTATVTGTSWTFTAATAQTFAMHTLQAAVQATGETALTNAKATSTTAAITLTDPLAAPIAVVSSLVATDDVATGGTYVGTLTAGSSTDDTVLALSGAYTGTIATGEVIQVFDGTTLLGTATVNTGANTWTFTTPTLAPAGHTFTAKVTNTSTNISSTSTGTALSGVAVVENGMGAIQTTVDSGTLGADTRVRYVMVRRVMTTADYFEVGELQVYSGGTNVAAGKTATTNATSTLGGWGGTSALTDGVTTGYTNTFITPQTLDGWVQVDLGGYYNISEVRVYTGNTGTRLTGANVFASAADMSGMSNAAQLVGINGVMKINSAALLGTTAAGAYQGATGSWGQAPAITDDTPTFSGVLTAGLGSDDVLGVYDGSTRLGDAVVTGSSWSFTVGTDGTVLAPLTSGSHTINVKIENAANTQTRLLSSVGVNLVSPTAPTAVVDSLVATDDVGTGTAYSAGNYTGALTSGQNTDDKVLALSGTFTGTLATGDVVQIYDGATLLGAATSTSATTNGTWTFTTSALTPGAHNLNAKVVSSTTGLFSTSTGTGASFNVVENNLGSVNLGVDTGVVGPEARIRYVMVRRTTASSDYFEVGEVEVYSGGTNVALNKAVLASHTPYNGTSLASTVTNGVPSTSQPTSYLTSAGGITDGWVQIDLGGYYVVSEVRVYTGSTNRLVGANVFGSATDMSGITHTDQMNGVGGAVKFNSAPLLGTTPMGQYQGATGTWGSAAAITDTSPTLTGTLDALIAGSTDVVAVYDNGTRLGTASVSGTSWSFRVGTDGDSVAHNDLLTAGTTHTFEVKIEDSTSNVLRVVQSKTFSVVAEVVYTAPTAFVDTLVVTDDVGTSTSYPNGNYTGALTNNMNTDDKVLTLSGTYSSTAVSGDLVKVFDNGVAIGSTTATGGTWTYTTSSLAAGVHSFTAQIVNSTSSLSSTSTAAAVSIIENNLPTPTLSVSQGGLGGGARYVMVKQTGVTTGALFVNEIEIYSNGVNVARNAGVTATAGPYSVHGGYSAAKTIDGSLVRSDGYAASANSTDNWIMIDLGKNYPIDSVTVKALSSSDLIFIRDVDVFASTQSMSSQTHAQLMANTDVVRLGGTGASPVYSQDLTTTAFPATLADTTPTLNGTLDAALGSDDVLAVYLDGSTTPLSTITPTGLTWSYTVPNGSELTAGVHTLKVQIENATTHAVRMVQTNSFTIVAGTVPTTTTTLVATDNVATNSSYVGTLTTDSSTDDTVLALSGTLSAGLVGERVDVYDGATLLGSATVTGTTWTYATGTLAAGSHAFTAKVVNLLSGLSGAASAALNVVESSVGGLQITVDTGTLVGGNTMTDTTPLLSGSIGATKGSADVVGVYIDGTRVGDATVTGTTWSFQVGTDGTSTALAAGSHTVQVKIESAGGAEVRVAGAVSTISTLASAPTAVVTSLVAADDVATNGSYVGNLTTDSSTDDTTLALTGAFTGTLNSGDVVQVFDGSQFLGLASTSSATNGTWSYTASGLTTGSHTFSAKVTNTVTSTFSTSTGSALGVTVVENSLSAIGISVDVGSVTGSTVSDTTPTFSGSLGAALVGGEKVTVYDTFNAVKTAIGTATIAANGTSWSFTPTTALPTGSHTITAVIQSSDGLQDRVASVYSGLIVATAPQAAVDSLSVTDNVGSSTAYSAGNATGAMPAGSNVDDTRPVISGTISQTLASGEVVRVYDTVNGVATLLGSATVTGTSWTFTPATALATGGHSITAQVANAATNATTNASTAYGVTVNSLGATITLTADAGTVVSTATSTVTSDLTPTFSGGLGATLGTADVVAVYIDGVRSGSATVTGTTWSYTPTVDLVAGNHLVTVQIENSSTNAVRMAQSKTFSVVGASTVPTAVVSTLGVTDGLNANAAGDFTGALTAGNITNDTRPTVSGTLSVGLGAGEVVQVYDNTSTLLGTATVTGTAWSFTAPALAIGAHSISAKVTNTLNSLSSTSTASALAFDVNTLGAVALSVTAGQTLVGSSTTDSTPTFSGTLGKALASGEVLGAYVDGVRKATITPTGTTWTYDAPTQLAGTHTFKVQIESSAGNVMRMAQSQAFSVVAGTTPTTVVNSIAAVDASGTTSAYANGNFTGTITTSGANLDDTKPVISGTLNQALATGEVVQVFDGSTLLATAVVSGTSWSYTPSVALATGSHTLTAKVTNTVSGLSSTSTGLAASGMQIVANSLGGITIGVDAGGVGADTRVRYVMVRRVMTTADYFEVGELQVYSGGVNVAAGKTATSNLNAFSAPWGYTTALTDGVTTGYANTFLVGTTQEGWIQVDLGDYYVVDQVRVYTGVVGSRLTGANVFASTTDMSGMTNAAQLLGSNGVKKINTSPLSGSKLEGQFDVYTGAWGAPATIADTTPVLTGTLGATTVGSSDVVGVYVDGVRKGAATVTVTGGVTSWSYQVQPADALSTGSHAIKVQVEDGTTGALRMVQTQTVLVTAGATPTASVNALTVTDDVGTVTGALTNNMNTDDTSLTVSGTYAGTLAAGDVVQVMDNGTVIGSAATSGSAWSFNTPLLAAGTHSFTAKVTNVASGASSAASAATAVIENAFTTEISGDTAAVNGYVRYVMVRQNNTTSSQMYVGEVEVWSNGTNVASGKTGTQKAGLALYGGYSVAGVTDGIVSGGGNGFANSQTTNDTWFQIDLGGSYKIDSIKIMDLGGNGTSFTNNLTVFGSAADMSAQTYAGLVGSATVNNFGTTSGMTVAGKSFANTGGFSTGDSTPTLSGTLAAALGSDDVLAVYDGTTLLSTVTPTGLNWSYTVPSGSELTAGVHTLKVQIENGTTNAARIVQSIPLTVLSATAPTATTTLAATDDVATNGSFVGALTNNSSTDDKVLALSGTLSAALATGEIVQVYDGTALLGTAIVSGTAWTYTTPTLAAGSHALSAKVTNAAGVSGAAASLTISEQSLWMGGQISGYLSATAPVSLLAGTGAGSRVADLTLAKLAGTLGGANVGSGMAANLVLADTSTAGQLKFWMTGFDGDKTYAVQVQLTDTVSGITAQALQSKSMTGNYTDGSFNFNASGYAVGGFVRVVATSSTAANVGVASLAVKQSSTTPITGTLGAALGSGEALGIYVDGVRVADNTSGVTITTQADGTVTWVFTPTASNLPAGNHTITAQVEDGTTRAARMVQTTSVSVASTVAPTAKVATLVVSDDNSTSYPAGDAIGTVTGSTDDTTPTISGTLNQGLAVGEVVQVFDGSKLLGNATVSGLTWTLTPGLAVGSHTLSAKVANSYDSALVSTSLASPVTIVVNTLGWSSLAADTGAALGNLMPTSGASGTTTLASTDSSPTIGGKLGNALAAGEQVGVYDNGTFLGTASVVGTSWTYTPSALSTAVHNLQVRIEDTATRTTRMALSQNFEVVAGSATPTTKVSTLTVTDAVSTQYTAGDRTGVLAANESTNDTKPVISGTLSAGLQSGEVVQVFDGSTLLGNATVNGFNWSYTTTTLQALATGAHTLSAKVVNTVSGNASAAASQDIIEQSMGAITVTPQGGTAQVGSGVRYIMVRKESTTAGFLTIADVQVLVGGVNIATGKTVTASQAAISGSSLGNLVDSTSAATGYLASTAYISATKATDNWVQIDLGGYYNVTSVVVKPEETKYTIGGSVVLASAQDMSGSTLTALKAGAAGAMTVGAIPVTDYNIGNSTFTVPTTAPAPSSTVSSATVTGALGAALVAGEQLGIYVKNGSGAYVYSGVATVAGDGTWTANLTGLAAGTNTIKAQVEDAFGVVRLAQTQTLNIVANATPTTTATITSVNDNQAAGMPTGGDFTGNLNSGDNTTDYTPTLTGSLSAALQGGEVVQVLDNGSVVGSATVSGTGWTSTPSADVAVGSHAYTVRVLNTANGNTGAASSAFTVVAQTLGEILSTVDTGTQNATSARYIMFRNGNGYGWQNILEMQVLSGGTNVALGKAVKQSNFAPSEGMSGSALVDGYKTVQGDTYWSSAHHNIINNDGWFQIDLGQAYAIDSVRFTSAYSSVVLSGGLIYASNQDMSGLTKGSLATSAALGNQGVTKLTTLDANAGGAAYDFVAATKGKVFTDTTPTFSGQLGTDLGSTDVVGVYVDGVRLGTATISGTGANTSWSYTPLVAQTTGDHTVKVQIERADGTMMLARSDTFSITTEASQTVAGMTALASTTEAAGTVTVSGMLSSAYVAGQKLAIYDGAASDSTLLGYATLSNGATSFNYSATGLGVGAHTLTARVLNVDGTAGSGTAGTATVTITASAPTQAVTVLGGYETAGAFATTGQGVNNLFADGTSTSSGNTTHLYVTGDSTPGMYGRLSSVLGTNESLKAYVDGVEVAGTLNVTGLNWNFTPTTGLTEGYHDLTFKVVDTTLSTSGAASTAYRVEVDAVNDISTSIDHAYDNYGVVTGDHGNGAVSDAPRGIFYGYLSQQGTGYVKVYENVAGSDVYVGSTTVTNSQQWSLTTDPLTVGSHAFKAVFVNTAGVAQTAAATTFTIDHQVQDGVVTNLTTLAGVDTASLTRSYQGLDLTKLGTSAIDKVDLGAFGGNSVKLSTADVLDAGTGLFTTAKGWTFANATDGTHAGTYHQMVMAGNSSTAFGASTVQIAEAANASNTNPWALTGTATNGGNTYNVYTNLATNNAQLLIDQNLAVSNVVL